jgi:uncharacterized protein (TIGR03435 family)
MRLPRRFLWVSGLLILVLQIGAQQAVTPRPQFEVVSIKPNNSGGPERYIRPSPGRLAIVNMTVKNLLRTAYGIMDFQISGGPNWIDSDGYDIEAKTDGGVTPREMTGPMLQSLLEQRFKLSVRLANRELPVYFMTVVNRGAALKPSAEQTCVPFDPSNPLLPGAATRNPNELCGSLGLGLTRLTGTQVTMPALAMAFTHLLGRRVMDRTNLTGEFDAVLTFAPLSAVPNGAIIDPALPDILTAVREQLGLKLESGNGPVEMLVIDRVERPSEN